MLYLLDMNNVWHTQSQCVHNFKHNQIEIDRYFVQNVILFILMVLKIRLGFIQQPSQYSQWKVFMFMGQIET